MAHIVSINSLAMMNIPFETHMAFHVPIATLIYISFETHLALAMAYILVRIHLAPHVPFKTLTMIYVFIKMCMAFHVPLMFIGYGLHSHQNMFGTSCSFRNPNYGLYFLKIHLAPHVLFGTLTMVYVPFEICVALAMVNIFIKMHLAHNIILNVFFETQIKIHYVF
jgi:hypothetical protein